MGPQGRAEQAAARLLDGHELAGVVVQAQVHAPERARADQLPARPVDRPRLRQPRRLARGRQRALPAALPAVVRGCSPHKLCY